LVVLIFLVSLFNHLIEVLFLFDLQEYLEKNMFNENVYHYQQFLGLGFYIGETFLLGKCYHADLLRNHQVIHKK